MSSSPNSSSSSGPHKEAEPKAPGTSQDRTPLISYRGVSKAFEDNVVLKDVDLDIYEGETLAVMGRSGCGKTVLTSMLVGLVLPDSGSITVGGVDITKFKSDAEWQELRLKTGYLFQGSALFDSMTVGENVGFPLVHHTRLSPREIAKKVHEKLDQVGLAGTEDLETDELSGGMQRRAALARTLALDPHLIIYDEPTAGLDPITADEIGRLIQRLRDTIKATSIMVTHDLHLAELVANRLVLIHKAGLVFEGTYEEFLESEQREVKRFLFLESQKESG